MIIPDTNILVHAHRIEMPGHAACLDLIDHECLAQGMGLVDTAALAFLRTVTHPHIFSPPSPQALALATLEEWLRRDHVSRIAPGTQYQKHFTTFAKTAQATGNDLYDVHLAACAMELGAELLSYDRGFARFPGLRWRQPSKAL